MPEQEFISPSLVIVVALFAMLGLASFWVWALVARRAWENRPPLPLHDRPLFPLDPADAAFVMLLWIGIPFVLVRVLGSGAEASPAEIAAVGAAGAAASASGPSLYQVQLNALANALLVIAALPILKFAPLRPGERYRLSDHGITLAGWKRETGYGALGFLAALIPVYLVIFATQMFRSKETQHEFLKIVQRLPSFETVAWMVLAAAILAPLAEELIFRVVLQGSLETRIGPALAIGASSVLFAAVHGWPDALPIFPLALILGYVYHRRRSYLAVVALHGLFNLWNLAVALAAS